MKAGRGTGVIEMIVKAQHRSSGMVRANGRAEEAYEVPLAKRIAWAAGGSQQVRDGWDFVGGWGLCISAGLGQEIIATASEAALALGTRQGVTYGGVGPRALDRVKRIPVCRRASGADTE